jgi:hypothetical protein
VTRDRFAERMVRPEQRRRLARPACGVAAYDDQLQTTIKASWTVAPYEIDGRPAAVCTSVTFVTH